MVYAARGCSAGPRAAFVAACSLFSGAGGLQSRGVAQFRDGRQALGGQHAAALQLPVLMLFKQHRTTRRVVAGSLGKMPTTLGAALDELEWASAPRSATLPRSNKLVLQILRRWSLGK